MPKHDILSSLKIVSYNIQGSVDKKLDLNDDCSLISLYDIVFLQETWLVESSKLHIDGYEIYRSERSKYKRGGVSVIFREHMKKGITKIKSANCDFLWIKLDKDFFGLKSNLYICNCYIPPENSDLHKQNDCDYFEILKAEVGKFSVLGEVMLMGDLNSRTGDIAEVYSSLDEDVPTDTQYIDNQITMLDRVNSNLCKRSNEDQIVNMFGRQLLSMVEQNHMAIVNGRKIGDLVGKTTCCTHNGVSTVDYHITTFYG